MILCDGTSHQSLYLRPRAECIIICIVFNILFYHFMLHDHENIYSSMLFSWSLFILEFRSKALCPYPLHNFVLYSDPLHLLLVLSILTLNLFPLSHPISLTVLGTSEVVC